MSDARSAISAYRQATYDGAPPLKIVRLMYEGALRFLAQAKSLDPARRPAEWAAEFPAEFMSKLDRSVAVVEELRLSLDPAHAPELARDLASLYLFVEERIQAARAQRSAEPLSSAERVLTTLLEGWAGLELPPAPPRAGAA